MKLLEKNAFVQENLLGQLTISLECRSDKLKTQLNVQHQNKTNSGLKFSHIAKSKSAHRNQGLKVVKFRAATIDGKRDHHESVPVVRVDLNHPLHVLDIGGPLIRVDAGEHVQLAGLHHGDHQLQGGGRVLPLLLVRHHLNHQELTALQHKRASLIWKSEQVLPSDIIKILSQSQRDELLCQCRLTNDHGRRGCPRCVIKALI